MPATVRAFLCTAPLVLALASPAPATATGGQSRADAAPGTVLMSGQDDNGWW